MILASFPSPSQGVWHIGPIPIRAYALCIVTGIIAALVIGDRRWVARGGEKGVIYDIALWAVPFGLVGGRLYHVMTDWSTYFTEGGAGFAGALRIWDGGLGIWGAVALGGVGAWIGCRVRGIPLPAFADAIAPGIILAQAIGRLGNYFNQELYGRETDMPWGLIIYDRENAAGQRDMLNGVSTGVPLFEHPVHPTFLYELLWNLLVFALLLWADRRFKLGHGRLFALYVAAYCVGRFCVELMRSDYATLIAGIRVNTFTSTFVFIGAVIYIMAAKKGREDPESLRGKYADDDADETGSGAPAEDLVAVGAVAVTATAVAGAAASDAVTDEKQDDAPAVNEPAEDEQTVEQPDAETEDEEPESEAAAEAEDLADAVQDLPDEEFVEADAVAETIAEAPPESEGLGSVDADEVAEAEVDAPDVHEAAVKAADEAEAVAAEVADEPEAESDDEGVEAEHDADADADAEVDSDADAEADSDGEPEAESDGEPGPVEGLGAVEGDDVEAATEAASDVHEAAIEAADEAEAVAEDTKSEDTEPEDTEPEDTESESATEDAGEPDSEGLGAVEGDEVEQAVENADEVHEAAEESAAEAESVADDVAAETSASETPAAVDPEPAKPAAAEPAEQAEPRKRWWRR